PDFPLEQLDEPSRPGDVPALAGAAALPSGPALEQDAIVTLARFGGINPESMRRLAALANARGMDASHAAQALQHLARRRPMNVARPTAAGGEAGVAVDEMPAVSPETAWVIAETRRRRAWQAAAVGGLLLLSLVSLGVLIALI